MDLLLTMFKNNIFLGLSKYKKLSKLFLNCEQIYNQINKGSVSSHIFLSFLGASFHYLLWKISWKTYVSRLFCIRHFFLILLIVQHTHISVVFWYLQDCLVTRSWSFIFYKSLVVTKKFSSTLSLKCTVMDSSVCDMKPFPT